VIKSLFNSPSLLLARSIERALQDSLNAAGQIAMGPMLEQFDTKGEPIRVGQVKHTVKDYAPQTYETPYGPVVVERHT